MLNGDEMEDYVLFKLTDNERSSLRILVEQCRHFNLENLTDKDICLLFTIQKRPGLPTSGAWQQINTKNCNSTTGNKR